MGILTSNVGADNNYVISRRDTKTGIKAQSRIRDTSGVVDERIKANGRVTTAGGAV